MKQKALKALEQKSFESLKLIKKAPPLGCCTVYKFVYKSKITSTWMLHSIQVVRRPQKSYKKRHLYSYKFVYKPKITSTWVLHSIQVLVWSYKSPSTCVLHSIQAKKSLHLGANRIQVCIQAKNYLHFGANRIQVLGRSYKSPSTCVLHSIQVV
jgi:hypothetical protein